MPCGWAAGILRPLSDGFRGPAHHRKQPRGKRSQDAWVTRLLRRGSYRIPVPRATRAWGTLPVWTVVLGHRDSKGPWTQARTLPWGPWRWPQAGGGWGGDPRAATTVCGGRPVSASLAHLSGGHREGSTLDESGQEGSGSWGVFPTALSSPQKVPFSPKHYSLSKGKKEKRKRKRPSSLLTLTRHPACE